MHVIETTSAKNTGTKLCTISTPKENFRDQRPDSPIIKNLSMYDSA